MSQSAHCAERLQTCLFCKLELPWKDLDQHQHVCGSRTELCGDCGRYVTLRDQSEHELTCQATPADRKPAPDTSNAPSAAPNVLRFLRCARCTASVPSGDIEKHKVSLNCPAEKLEPVVGSTSTCVPAQLSCRLSAMFDELKEPQRGPPSSIQGALPPLGSRSLFTRGGHRGDVDTCPHCHLTLPTPTLLWHQVRHRHTSVVGALPW